MTSPIHTPHSSEPQSLPAQMPAISFKLDNGRVIQAVNSHSFQPKQELRQNPKEYLVDLQKVESWQIKSDYWHAKGTAVEDNGSIIIPELQENSINTEIHLTSPYTILVKDRLNRDRRQQDKLKATAGYNIQAAGPTTSTTADEICFFIERLFADIKSTPFPETKLHLPAIQIQINSENRPPAVVAKFKSFFGKKTAECENTLGAFSIYASLHPKTEPSQTIKNELAFFGHGWRDIHENFSIDQFPEDIEIKFQCEPGKVLNGELVHFNPDINRVSLKRQGPFLFIKTDAAVVNNPATSSYQKLFEIGTPQEIPNYEFSKFFSNPATDTTSGISQHDKGYLFSLNSFIHDVDLANMQSAVRLVANQNFLLATTAKNSKKYQSNTRLLDLLRVIKTLKNNGKEINQLYLFACLAAGSSKLCQSIDELMYAHQRQEMQLQTGKSDDEIPFFKTSNATASPESLVTIIHGQNCFKEIASDVIGEEHNLVTFNNNLNLKDLEKMQHWYIVHPESGAFIPAPDQALPYKSDPESVMDFLKSHSQDKND